MKPTLIPYLNFDGTTGEAMKFYHSILGGELKMQTFGESGMEVPEGDKDKIIHAELKNEGVWLMASDGDASHPVTMGNNVHLSVMGSDLETLTKWFNALAEGGEVNMALAKQFWGDTYGQLTDKFGQHWMFNISQSS